jgi:RNA polymerase sigma-70 factor (ECF subfamily)
MQPLVLTKLNSKDEQEFMANLCIKYKRLAYSEVRKIVSDAWAIQDIMQDSIIRLAEKVSLLQTFDERKLVNYIITTVRNQAKNHLRKVSSDITVCSIDNDDLSIENIIKDDTDVEQSVIRRELFDSFSKVWLQLDETYKTLLEDKYILNKTDSDIAYELGVKPASVRMMLTRARRAVFDELKKIGSLVII